MEPITGASNVQPCPHCTYTWFTTVSVQETYWEVKCHGCGKQYIKMIRTDLIPNIDPIRGY